jgi:hypothetical protein
MPSRSYSRTGSRKSSPARVLLVLLVAPLAGVQGAPAGSNDDRASDPHAYVEALLLADDRLVARAVGYDTQRLFENVHAGMSARVRLFAASAMRTRSLVAETARRELLAERTIEWDYLRDAYRITDREGAVSIVGTQGGAIQKVLVYSLPLPASVGWEQTIIWIEIEELVLIPPVSIVRTFFPAKAILEPAIVYRARGGRE